MVDALNDPRARNVEPARAAGVVSVGIVPLLIGQKVLGALAIGVRARHQPTSEEMQLLGSLASHAANAINNAQLYREATRQAQRMSALADLGRLLSATLDLDLVAPAGRRQRASPARRPLVEPSTGSIVESGALVAFAVSGEAGVALGRDVRCFRGAMRSSASPSEVEGPVATPNLLADPRFIFTAEMRARHRARRASVDARGAAAYRRTSDRGARRRRPRRVDGSTTTRSDWPKLRRSGGRCARERAALHGGHAPPARGRGAGAPGADPDRESRPARRRRADRQKRARALSGEFVRAATSAGGRLAGDPRARGPLSRGVAVRRRSARGHRAVRDSRSPRGAPSRRPTSSAIPRSP